ncbi:ATP-binding protein [Fundidesulfovibrio butyratiphilus]
MRVAVVSGKGGVGKTTVASGLISVWDRPVVAVDLDVEEPNLHLFLRPDLNPGEDVYMEVPVADASKCVFCKKCSRLCQFGAIAVMGKKLLVFPDLCHSCGGCLAICPEEGALTPGKRLLGSLLSGKSPYGDFLMGDLRVGEAMSPPLIRAVKHRVDDYGPSAAMDAVLDCPPGVSCPAINAARDSDLILIVVEPTRFGFHDFNLAWQAFSTLDRPLAVVINRAGTGDTSVESFCREKGLPVLCKIPYDRTVAAASAKAEVAHERDPALRKAFEALRDGLRRVAGQGGDHA